VIADSCTLGKYWKILVVIILCEYFCLERSCNFGMFQTFVGFLELVIEVLSFYLFYFILKVFGFVLILYRC